MRWEQHGAPSSHWTTAVSNQWFFGIVLLVFLAHLWLAHVIPLFDDELYYWSWSKELSWSYFDHPPMVAWLISFSRRIFGDTALGIRFFAVSSASLLILAIGAVFRARRLSTALLFTPLFFWGGLLMTPDSPLVVFWALYVIWMGSTARTLSSWSDDPVTRVYHQSPVPLWRWGIGGVVLGLGLLSKYTMFLAIPSSLAVLLLRYRGKAWLLGFAIHLAVAAAIFSPVLIFNYQHDFVSFKFQWAHSMASSSFSLSRLSEFISVQAILIGALPFLMLPWVVLTAADYCEEPRAGVHFSFYLLPLCFFLLRSVRLPLEANWALVSYLSFWGLAQRVFDYSSFKFFGRALTLIGFAPAFIVTLLVGIHLVHPFSQVPPEKDRIARAQTSLDTARDVVRVVSSQALSHASTPVLADNYQWVAALRFFGGNAQQLFGAGRPSQFTLRASDPCQLQSLYWFGPSQSFPENLNCFPNRKLIAEFPTTVRGKTIGVDTLQLFSK